LPSVSPTISLSTPLPNNEVFPFELMATIIIAIIAVVAGAGLFYFKRRRL
jgi:LPXTG-motif cell wall-anchored protein